MQRWINRTSTFTLILIDDHSRFVPGHGVDDAERADMVIRTFEEAVVRHGKPEQVMHDKGSAFWSWRGISRFTALLTELGIDQVVAEEKEWNGKVEAFHSRCTPPRVLRSLRPACFDTRDCLIVQLEPRWSALPASTVGDA